MCPEETFKRKTEFFFFFFNFLQKVFIALHCLCYYCKKWQVPLRRDSFMGGIWATAQAHRPRLLCSTSCLMCFSVSGKIPVLRPVPCGCGLGERHSNVFVTQEGGNCKCFLHNCAFVPLPGGSRASPASSVRPVWPRSEGLRELQEHIAEARESTTFKAAENIFNLLLNVFATHL